MEKNRIHEVLLWVVGLCVATTHANARIYGNVDKVGTPKLQESSARAGAAFLDGSSSLWQMFALLEIEKVDKKAVDKAIESGSAAVKHLERANQLFPEAANLVDQAVRERLKSVEPKAAAELVSLQAGAPIVKQLTVWANEGAAEELLRFCGTRAGELREKTEGFVQFLKEKRLDETADGRIRGLISEWRIVVVQGQYVSSLFSLAGQAKR